MDRNNHGDIRLTIKNAAVWVGIVIATVVIAVALLFGVGTVKRSYNRHQAIADANNRVKVTAIQIKNTQQLVEVENQKAQVRVAEAHGISDAQSIINGTLTALYLQHEAIQAQLEMAHSENHTIVYIPIGNEGIPLVGTIDTTSPEETE